MARTDGHPRSAWEIPLPARREERERYGLFWNKVSLTNDLRGRDSLHLHITYRMLREGKYIDTCSMTLDGTADIHYRGRNIHRRCRGRGNVINSLTIFPQRRALRCVHTSTADRLLLGWVLLQHRRTGRPLSAE